MDSVALQTGVVELIRLSVRMFVADLIGAIPKLIAGLTFLVLAAIAIKLVAMLVRFVLRRILPGERDGIYVQFISTTVSVFLWFGALLSVLSLLGLTAIAAALGTASGFLALGVSYALSGMIADGVAGIYLLRDPDFNVGDRITANDTTGVVQAIELRKTRILVDGEDDTTRDIVVRANAEIEKKWTKYGKKERE